MKTIVLLGSLLLAVGSEQPAASEAMWSSDPATWHRVAMPLEAPVSGVAPAAGSLFRAAIARHKAYLLADSNVDDMVYRFRKVAGVAKPPGQLRGWENTFPAHAAQFLIGAGNTLRWGDDPQLRQRMNQVIDALEVCRTPDGLLVAPAAAGEEGYSFMLLAHGLDAAARAGNPRANALLAAWAKWYRQVVARQTCHNPTVRALRVRTTSRHRGSCWRITPPAARPAMFSPRTNMCMFRG